MDFLKECIKIHCFMSSKLEKHINLENKIRVISVQKTY